MVIGEGYAWAHLPKTGGDATLAMFRLFPDLVEFADPEDTNDKHAQFHSRARLIRGKLLVMNFRRLPLVGAEPRAARVPARNPSRLRAPADGHVARAGGELLPRRPAAPLHRTRVASIPTAGCAWSRWPPTSST